MDAHAPIEWDKLGFSYMKTDKSYFSYWKDGKWDEGRLTEEHQITISEAATALHYGQQVFEGLKAYRRKDGKVQLFRPDQNALRMQQSARRILMPEVPVERFIQACVEVVRANERFVPPYGTGGSLYIRPYLIGINGTVAVAPATEYLFGVFAFPVGAYFKGGMKPVYFSVTFYDRAAPNGTGSAKAGGNYAGSMLPHELARQAGFADCIYLDPATHTKIEEVGSANFFGITKEGTFVTPKSSSILPSITKYSLLYLAEHVLGLKVEERDVYLDELDQFVEAGACGTAAVITPIGGIEVDGKMIRFGEEGEVGPITKKLYDLLTGIQFGDIEAPEGWILEIGADSSMGG